MQLDLRPLAHVHGARSTPRRMDFAARLTIHSSDSDSDGSTQPDDTEPDTGACSLR